MKKTIYLLLFYMACTLFLRDCYSASLYPNDKYDKQINHAVKRFSPGRDWTLLKAQLWQESRFKINAVSHAGAMGIGQFMHETWIEQTEKLGVYGSPYDADLSILIAAQYMQQQYKSWSYPRPELDRENLALCNYNAGFGNCLKAQKLSGGKLLYREIIVFLPSVTGHHAKETMNYIPNIRKYQLYLRAYR